MLELRPKIKTKEQDEELCQQPSLPPSFDAISTRSTRLVDETDLQTSRFFPLLLDVEHERLLETLDDLGSPEEFLGRDGVVRLEGRLEEGLVGRGKAGWRGGK